MTSRACILIGSLCTGLLALGHGGCFHAAPVTERSIVYPPDTTYDGNTTPAPTNCPLVVSYPADDPNTPWSTNIVSLMGCNLCVNVEAGDLNPNGVVGARWCNDAQMTQYWHWVHSQIYADEGNTLCITPVDGNVLLQPCQSLGGALWDFVGGTIRDARTKTCLTVPGHVGALKTAACNPNDPNQQFAIAHAKVAQLVQNVHADIQPTDTLVVHGAPIENANNFHCLHMLAANHAATVSLVTAPCSGGAAQQWVLQGNDLRQNNLCLGFDTSAQVFTLVPCGTGTYQAWSYTAGGIRNNGLVDECLQIDGHDQVALGPCRGSEAEWFAGGN